MSTDLMQAAVVAEPRKVCISTVAIPEPGPGQVRVRLEGCGVCGSNVAPWEGRPWFQYPLSPGELGHEGWGFVDALGAGVSTLRRGDRVALLSYRACAEYDIASESAVVPLPAVLEGKPFPGEPLGCAMNVFERCAIQPGHSVAVIGIGFLGAMLTALSKKAGARVVAVSRRRSALDAARQMGADETIVLEDSNAAITWVKELTEGKGCDRVIEAAGQESTLSLAAELTRERGRLIIAGYHQDGPRVINLQLWNWRGLDVINAHERDPGIYTEGMRRAVNAVASRTLDPFPLYTHEFRLEELGYALEAMRERPQSFMKALIKM